MLDWIFEGVINWISSIVSQMMDAVSGLFLQALGTDMTAMEEYFPFVAKAFTVMQYMGWAILFLITVWQLFRVFGGPITEAENPWVLLARSALFALLIGYAKPIFSIVLDIARAPYTALMELSMTAEDFTFAGVEQALANGLTTIVAIVSIVGLLLLIILEISLGWNYFKLLLETVERYIVVGVLCYTSPLAYSMGASKATSPVFKSWCRMVGSQMLLLVSVIRSRDIRVMLAVQSLGQLQNRYGNNLWAEIIGNCDIQLMLGCTDDVTADYFSERSGDMSVMVNSTMTVRQTIAVAQVIPQYRHTEGQGKRRLLTSDEVLRLPNTEMLVVIRGCNVLKLEKLDYTKHWMAKLIDRHNIAEYTPRPVAPVFQTDFTSVPSAAEKPREPARKKKLYSSAKPPTEF